MGNLEDIYKIPLPSTCCQCFEGIAFDGCYYYVTKPQSCKIMKYTKDFKLAGYFDVCRKYSKICYDSKENCFWATSWCSYYCIYKLDYCFNEIDRLLIYPDLGGCKVITGISYDCANDRLLVSFGEELLNVYKDGDFEVLLKNTGTDEFSSVMSMSPYFAVLLRNESSQIIRIYDSNKNIIAEYAVLYEYLVKEMVLVTQVNSGVQEVYIGLLTAKSCCYPYVLLKKIPISELGIVLANCNLMLEPDHYN